MPSNTLFWQFFSDRMTVRVERTRPVSAPPQMLMTKTGKTLLVLMLMVVSASLQAAFSINSDSSTQNEDSLYSIDLGSGLSKRVASLSPAKTDVEGLAFAPDGTLYAIDDESLTLFPLNPSTALVDTASEVLLTGLSQAGRNDFGMTFACDGTLYVTSIAENALYRVALGGQATRIGSLGVNISGIAAHGNPTRLYGLGNGLRSTGGDVVQVDVPNLYEIDTATGAASLVGPLGDQIDPYTEGGLDFDASGQLWAITDRRVPDNQPSQVFRIDRNSGTASGKQVLSEIGFESLAIAPPAGCDPDSEPPPPPPPEPIHSRIAGVPTLGTMGLALAVFLLLTTGLVATRRL